MARTVADLMVATLKASGVRRMYGVPGDSLNGLTDALRRDGGITWQHVRHEEAAAFAAAGEAAVTGELAVCAGSCGPGNLHLINGLFDADRSRVPVLAIAAQIPRDEIGSGYFQETHPQDLFRECSVYTELVSIPSQLPWVLQIAMRTALARSGVAVVVVPGEVFLADAPADAKPMTIRPVTPLIRPADAALDAAAAVLNAAERVTILAGAGCAGAHDRLLAIAGALQAPVVHAFRGKEFVEYDNPYDVGMTGLIGFSSGYRAMEHCDALLMLGTDFPYRQFYPEGVPVVQVDVRGEQIGRRVPVDVPLVGTVRDTVDALLPRLTAKTGSAHLDRMTAHYRRARSRLDSLAKSAADESPLHPQHVTAVIDRLAADDAVFTADVGTPCIWAARYLHMNGRRRLIGSFNHGSMANALPQAIGAQAEHPDRQVVSLSGDGGLAMLLGELITLHQMQLPVKVVVFNNGSLSFVELEMKAAGFVTFATDLDNPDFAAIAEAAGLFGARVDKAGDLEDALRAAFAHPGAALVDVRTARHELSLPPKLTFGQIKGFTLYATRTILSGRGSEIVELAKTNLRDLDAE
ncbi:ubiquinone-dependent pyruvate dehydrogenase [Catellatospora citrea]|uniref:Pyruvate dehydrogenase [ubiquinone] n=1 Tax=Catellatospora citrea TaxID=53366 RepID=A0A8J3KBG5_9ACTN|nr:ubiquinone-dependent pyruvate dehydrogenase [Catellatospora citrea]RKE05896.1 pyruvate dehydrogenase (quinone) [Catellatospora citrea]GIF97559.1 pyruvate dehydrogenase [Catellatospora citrea]